MDKLVMILRRHDDTNFVIETCGSKNTFSWCLIHGDFFLDASTPSDGTDPGNKLTKEILSLSIGEYIPLEISGA